MRGFAQKFKVCTRNAGMAKGDAKVDLVLALNQDTLSCLDACVTICGGDKMGHLETIQDRLRCFPYVQMLVYLK